MSETVQTILSQFDSTVMFLVWKSYKAYRKGMQDWSRQVFKAYKEVNSITHVDEERTVLGYSKRTESGSTSGDLTGTL